METESDIEVLRSQMMGKTANVGKVWSEEERKKLLEEISKGLAIKTIAENHQRMVGGITSKLKEIAADYYYNNELPIEKIQKFTGLSKEDIIDSISKRAWKEEQKKNKALQNPKAVKAVKVNQTDVLSIPPENNRNELKEILEVLKDIQSTLHDFVKGNYVKIKKPVDKN